jgi:Homeodomain-like domain
MGVPRTGAGDAQLCGRPPMLRHDQRYVVSLAERERAALRRRLAAGRGRARELLHTRVLLKADQGPHGPGWTDEAIAAALDVSGSTVERVRREPERTGDRGRRAMLSLRARQVGGRGRRSLRRVFAIEILVPGPATAMAVSAASPARTAAVGSASGPDPRWAPCATNRVPSGTGGYSIVQPHQLGMWKV